MAKCFIFRCIFGDLDRVETGVSEEGINSLEAKFKFEYEFCPTNDS